ncbi:MAG TPA: long-chain fatty acid--CoA ligase [Bacteroidia bacterium]|nr:long-chain fatty acid--CoA ligase [Bacteroidia bacterium]
MSEPTRVFDLLDFYPAQFGDKPDMYAGKVNGVWKTWSASTAITAMHDVAAGLIQSGVKRGDRVGIMAANRPEWNIIDFGVQLSGAVLVPVYPNLSEGDLAFVIKDAGLVAFFTDTSTLGEKVSKAAASVACKVQVYTIEENTGFPSWTTVVADGKKNPHTGEIDAVKRETTPDTLLTLLYTSGTTGTPKGVMLTHNNLVSNFTILCDLPPVDHTHRALSFLPLNHIYERMLSYLYLYRGPSIYYAESLEKVAENIRELKPEMFTCVPRLIEKVYDRIITKGEELKGVKRWLFFWAVELGEQYDIDSRRSWWYNFRLSIVSKLIFSKWREALGGNVRCMVSGGAALNVRLCKIFWAAGMPVLEGYGLTETSPVIAVNTLERDGIRFGTVGAVIRNNTVKIAEDGEILVKGPNVMKGYWNRPDATAEVIDSEGWFHTGDIGEFIEGRYLKITDRKKEIFKTSGGKYIAPQRIENFLNASRFIEQSMIIGEGEKFAAAIVVPAFSFVREWAAHKKIDIGTSNEEIAANKDVRDRIMKEVEIANKNLAQYEQIKKIMLIPRVFSVDSGELTPKLSLKRKVVMKNYEAQIAALFA